MISKKLRTLQILELKTLLEIKRICEKYSIKYFLIGGTLLGAVRHQGFIPWDDDIDIGMFREDYNKFIDVCSKEIGSEFFLQTINTDSNYAQTYAKIRLNGTEYIEPMTANNIIHHGIWVDIFAFDNLPSDKLSMVYYGVTRLVNSITYHKCKYTIHYDEINMKMYHSICKILASFISKERVIQIREQLVQRYNTKNTERIINWPFKVAKREYFDELIELPFETVLFPVPKMYHEYLTSFYGDYMRIPPENERPKHSPHEPDFGKYSYIKSLDDVLPKKE